MTDPSLTATASAAVRAYEAAQPATRPVAALDPAQAGSAADSGFAGLANDFVRALTDAERTVEAGLVGRADPQAVVEALAATEIAVQTAVAVRDRVVEAYQEILRMPV